MSKVVVITGAAGGIGSALARKLDNQGYSLVLSDIADMQSLAAELDRSVRTRKADVTVFPDMLALANFTIKKRDRIDAWVHCAGVGINRSVLSLRGNDLNGMVRINVIGMINAVQACIPTFKDRGRGQFIYISSALVDQPWRSPFRSAYTGAKAMAEVLLSCLEADLKDYPGIQIIAHRLKGVDTGFARRAWHSTPDAVSTTKDKLSAEQAAAEIVALIQLTLDHAEPQSVPGGIA